MVDRNTEFAPVKNADGPDEPLPDTPAFARKMILAEATQWLKEFENEGLSINPNIKGSIEVSFLLSYQGENLKILTEKHKNQVLDGTTGYIDHEGDFHGQN